MKCEEFLLLLPMYPDNIPAQSVAEFRAHASECADCGERLAEHNLMMTSLQSLDDGLTVPEEFQRGWRAAIGEEAAPKRVSPLKSWRGWALAATACVMVVTGAALLREGILSPSIGPDTQTAYFMETSAGQAAPKRAADTGEAPAVIRSAAYDAPDASQLPESEAQAPVILHTASIYLDTEQYDRDIEEIDRLLEETGGWSEYWSVSGEPLASNPASGRFASMMLRVPMNALDMFVSKVTAIGTVTSSEMSAEDVSSSYYDVQGRLHMYESQRDRLTELLSQAASIADIIEIESRLSEVQYTIETLTGRINLWDSRANNAVVRVNVMEVAWETAGGSGRRPLWPSIKDAFSRSFQAAGDFLADALVFLVMATPYIAIVVVAGLVIMVIAKARKKTRQRSHEE